MIAERRAQLQSDLLHWIEIHPASSSGHACEVMAKGRWLLGWLKETETPLRRYERKLIWVASGQSAFNARDPHLKTLAMMGIQYAGGHLEI